MKNFLLPVLALSLLGSCSVQKELVEVKKTPKEIFVLFNKNLKPFYHGVASGDPLQDAVIIWTRVTPEVGVNSLEVTWSMSLNEDMSNPIKSGSTKTNAEKDYTVKIDVKGLEAGTTYYYQFQALGAKSIIGRTKTAPSKDQSQDLAFAFASCSNYEWGYFNGYAQMAEDDELNAIIHLGDYIYEYAPGGYGDTTIGRIVYPQKEITTLEDYRHRYSQYRTDEDLMRAHQMHPFITIWDDHELANNAWLDGAQNHNEDEGEGNWGFRKNWARQVYYEWMPVRDANELYRSFQFGNMAHLIMLDTRLTGRTEQVDSMQAVNYADPERTIIGKKQFSWLVKELQTSATWKIIGNQVPFGPMINDYMEGKGRYMDGWDGYPVERERLINEITEHNIADLIWMTGDYHSSFAFETDLNASKQIDESNIGVEFVVPSINSANTNEYVDDERTSEIEAKYLEYNPHLRYVNLRDHGYVNLKLTNQAAEATFIYSKTTRERNKAIKAQEKMRVQKSTKKIERID